MRTRLPAAVIITLAFGCGTPNSGPIVPDGSEQPSTIDGVIEARLSEAGLEPVLADRHELCRRLGADLLGRFPSADEVGELCPKERSAGEIAALMQGRDEYLVTSIRHWRDRLGTSDVRLNHAFLTPAYELVAALHRDELGYGEFATEILAGPALTASHDDPVNRAHAVHRVFLGGVATEAAALDLSRLTRIWDRRDGDFFSFSGAVMPTFEPWLVPGRCQFGACETRSTPGGSIDFPDPGAFPFNGIKYVNLSEEQRMSLHGLGKFVVAQNLFYEAAADEILDRLLSWSDGGLTPRRPGRLLPRVRQLVASHLRETGSYASAERLVIDSLLYRQTNDLVRIAEAGETTDRPIWATGPLRHAPAEVVINTVRGTSLADGTCDPRFADDTPYEQHQEALTGASITAYNQFITDFHAAQGNWQGLIEGEIELVDGSMASGLVLDHSYRDLARLFGGCPGDASARLTNLDGLTYAFGQEVAASLLCDDFAAQLGADATPIDTTAHRLLGRTPTETERTILTETACGDCSATELSHGFCTALLGSDLVLFY